MAFSWQKEKKKEEVAPTNFSWGKTDAPKKAATTQAVSVGGIPGVTRPMVIPLPTKEQQAARLKIDAYTKNSPANLAKETAKGVVDTGKKVVQSAAEGWKSVKPADKSVKNLYGNLQESPKEGGRVWADAVTDLATRWEKYASAWKRPDASKTEKVVATGSALMGGVNMFFAPISGAMKTLSPIPGIGHVADKVEQLFAAIGSGAGALASDSLDGLPISKEKKETLRPLVEETAAFAAMIAVGKAGEFSYTRAKTNVNTLLTELKSIDAKTVAGVIDRSPVGSNPMVDVKVRAEPTKVPVVEQLSAKPVNPQVRQGYEPYVPDSQLPVIDAGSGRRSPAGLKTIQADAPKSKGEFTYEPIKPPEFSWNKPEAKPKIPEPTPKQLELVPEARSPEVKVAETKLASEPKPIREETTSSTFKSETSVKFKDEAARRGYEDTVEVPEQIRRKKVDDWRRSDGFVESDVDRAMRVVRGQEDVPTGMLVEDVYKSLELRALDTGDMGLINELIPLRVGTEAGRGLQALNRGETSATNPIEIARSIETDRANSVGGEKAIKKAKAETKVDEIKAPDKSAWDKFIDEITC